MTLVRWSYISLKIQKEERMSMMIVFVTVSEGNLVHTWYIKFWTNVKKTAQKPLYENMNFFLTSLLEYNCFTMLC